MPNLLSSGAVGWGGYWHKLVPPIYYKRNVLCKNEELLCWTYIVINSICKCLWLVLTRYKTWLKMKANNIVGYQCFVRNTLQFTRCHRLKKSSRNITSTWTCRPHKSFNWLYLGGGGCKTPTPGTNRVDKVQNYLQDIYISIFYSKIQMSCSSFPHSPLEKT